MGIQKHMAEVPPVLVNSFVSALQKCRREKNIVHAMSLYAYMQEYHLESHKVLGNYLVPMLVDCGRLPDAMSAFGKLECPNIHAWTSLIAGYSSNGDSDVVINLCIKMQEWQGIQPNQCVHLAQLSACAMLKDLGKGQSLHTEIVKRGLELQHFKGGAMFGNKLVHMYAKCGMLAEARHVLSMLPENAISWAALIVGYTENGLAYKAVESYREMQVKGVSPDLVSILCCMKACGMAGAAEIGQEMHHEATKRGLESELYLGSALVDMYAKCGWLTEAGCVLNFLPVRNGVSWGALIAGYAEHGLDTEVQKCLQRMHLEHVWADPIIYVSSLKACGIAKSLDMGLEIHAEVTRKGLGEDEFVSSVLVDMYVKCGLIQEACQVFERLQCRHAFSWNALIAGYAEEGCAVELHRLIHDMRSQYVLIDVLTFGRIVKAEIDAGHVATGKLLHSEAIERGIETEGDVHCSLVEMYVKYGLLAEAHSIFDILPVQNALAWSALIAGYAECGLTDEAYKCFGQMQTECMFVNSFSIAACLKACGMMTSLERGYQLHTEIIKRGGERESFVGNTLVDMYVKCGLLEEAQEVFNTLPVKDAVSWAALVAGYAEHSLDKEVMDCFDEMRLQYVPADAVTFVCILQSCSSIKAVETGWLLHTDIAKRGLDEDLYVGSMLVNMYSRCESLTEAQEVFDHLPCPDAVSLVALIFGYSMSGLYEKAIACFWKSYNEGMPIDVLTFVCGLKACTSARTVGAGQAMHSELCKRGLDMDLLLGGPLVAMYIKNNAYAEAAAVFKKMPLHNAFLQNALIAEYIDNRLGEEIGDLFYQNQLGSFSPNFLSVACSLKMCGVMKHVETGQKLHMGLTYRGLEKHTYIVNTLVDMYSKCSSLTEAQQVLEALQFPSPICITTLVLGYIEHGLAEEAAKYVRQIQMKGLFLDSVTCIGSLKACSAVRDIQLGNEMHAEATKRGLEEDPYVSSALIIMYATCGLLADAHQVFVQASFKDAAVWNALITGFGQFELHEEVLKCFKQMQLEGRFADAITFVLCLKACTTAGALETGRCIHAEAKKAGLVREIIVGNMLVSMYGICGSLEECREAFDELPVRDVVSWTALIKAYGENQEENLAIECFEEMKKQGVKPNYITFTCLLAMCSHEGHIHQGGEYFKYMIKGGEIELTLHHCACMVSLFGRSGHVYEAEKFVASIGFPPSRDLLMALLTVCKNYGKIEAGERCFQQLIELNLEDASAYIIMAELYANAHVRNAANKVEKSKNYSCAKEILCDVSIKHREPYGFVLGADEKDIFGNLYFQTLHEAICRHTIDEFKEGLLSESVTDSFLLGYCGLIATSKCVAA